MGELYESSEDLDEFLQMRDVRLSVCPSFVVGYILVFDVVFAFFGSMRTR